jgi:hypothetical protein
VSRAPEVVLSTEQEAEAERIAEITYERFKTFAGNYRTACRRTDSGNSLEMGAETWIEQLNCVVEPVFAADAVTPASYRSARVALNAQLGPRQP